MSAPVFTISGMTNADMVVQALKFKKWTWFSPFVSLAATLIEAPSIIGVKRKVVHTPLITYIYSKRGKSPTVIENSSIAFRVNYL